MALSKKLRPIRWDEVIGQDAVKELLKPAIEQQQISHAYLFSGPRGVGKTTTARLIAMQLVCTQDQKPCGECSACQSVIAGRHPDVIEIDAASNNSVDDVRELREKVGLQPMNGHHRVYILDEAHMMSKSAFNALLKTLEEPPSHVVFVLATTEPERLPPTIVSRCQHYRFRRLKPEEIAQKLEKIAQTEGVLIEKDALLLIASAAEGAMRDGESLLTKLLTKKTISLKDVENALGLPSKENLDELSQALIMSDAQKVMTMLSELYFSGFAPRTLTEQVKLNLRNIWLKSLEPKLLSMIRILDDEDSRFIRANDLFSLELAFIKAIPGVKSDTKSLSVPEIKPKETKKIEKAKEIDKDPDVLESKELTWDDVVKKAGPQLKAFLKEGKAEIKKRLIVLNYGPKYRFHADNVARRLTEVQSLVTQVLGDYRLEIASDFVDKAEKIEEDDPPDVDFIENVEEIEINATSDLNSHPNYQLLAKHFPHRILFRGNKK